MVPHPEFSVHQSMSLQTDIALRSYLLWTTRFLIFFCRTVFAFMQDLPLIWSQWYCVYCYKNCDFKKQKSIFHYLFQLRFSLTYLCVQMLQLACFFFHSSVVQKPAESNSPLDSGCWESGRLCPLSSLAQFLPHGNTLQCNSPRHQQGGPIAERVTDCWPDRLQSAQEGWALWE